VDLENRQFTFAASNLDRIVGVFHPQVPLEVLEGITFRKYYAVKFQKEVEHRGVETNRRPRPRFSILSLREARPPRERLG
jgi:hypothetical protein